MPRSNPLHMERRYTIEDLFAMDADVMDTVCKSLANKDCRYCHGVGLVKIDRPKITPMGLEYPDNWEPCVCVIEKLNDENNE